MVLVNLPARRLLNLLWFLLTEFQIAFALQTDLHSFANLDLDHPNILRLQHLTEMNESLDVIQLNREDIEGVVSVPILNRKGIQSACNCLNVLSMQ